MYSPTLFAIFIDGLAREVKARNLGAEVGPQVGARKSQRLAKLRKNQQQQSGVSVSLLLFADDIALMTSSAENLQDMLRTVDQYCHGVQLAARPQPLCNLGTLCWKKI